MPWQITIVLHVFISSFRAVQSRRIGKYRQDVSLYALTVSFLFVFLIGLAYSLFNWESVAHNSAWEARWFLVTGGVLFGVLNLLTIKLFRLVPASIAVIMSLLNSVSVVIFAYIITNESLTNGQWFGTGILFIAVLLVSFFTRDKKRKNIFSISVGFLIALIAALLFGPAIVNEKYLLDRLGVETYLLYGWGMQSLSAISLAFILRNKSKKSYPIRIHIDVLIYAILLGISGIFFVMSLVGSDSSSLTTVSASAKVVLSAMLAYIFLKERDFLLVKSFSLLLSIGGLYFLFS